MTTSAAMSKTPSLAELLENARRRKIDVDTAVDAFRALPFDDQLRFLITIEGDVIARVGGGPMTIPLAAASEPCPTLINPIAEAPVEVRVEAPVASAEAPLRSTAPAKIPLRPSSSEPAPTRGYGPEVISHLTTLYDRGLSYSEITTQARITYPKISYPTVSKLLHAAGRKPRAGPGQKKKKPSADDTEESPQLCTSAVQPLLEKPTEVPRYRRRPRQLKPVSLAPKAVCCDVVKSSSWHAS